MTAIANAIRAKTGGSISLTLDGMATEIAGLSKPAGSLSVTANGTYDVTEKASAVVNVPTPSYAQNIWRVTFTLATHSSADVTLCTLPDWVYSHIGDDNFSVSLLCADCSNLVQYDEYMFVFSNNPELPLQGTYPVYGIYNRKTGTTTVSQKPGYYQPKDTSNSVSLGSSKIWHSGSVLKYKSSSYYLGAGTYDIIVSW